MFSIRFFFLWEGGQISLMYETFKKEKEKETEVTKKLSN